MVVLLVAIFLLVFWGDGSHACTVEAHSRYIKTERRGEFALSDVVKRSDCRSDVKRRFIDILSTSSGKVNRSHLKKIIDNVVEVKIQPEKIEFVDLEELLKNEYPLKKNWVFKNTYFTGRRQLYPYGTDERIQVLCRNCHIPGKKILEVIFYNSSNGNRKVVWGETHVAVRMRSLVALRTLETRSVLNPDYFKDQFSYTMSDNESFFIDKKKLLFYKTNKVVREGMVLKFSDLSPVNLVSVGKVAKTIIKKDDMKLTGVGIPLKNGRWGESIHLKGMDGKRMIIGKVVDFDTVEVGL